MAATYLDKLNDQQRAAAVFGGDGPATAPPLLVIAGAGSPNKPATATAGSMRCGQGSSRAVSSTASKR